MDGDGGSGTAAGGQYFRVLTDGGRQRYEVALKPGETTIVSWKKLVRDANSNRAAAADAKGKSPAVELPSVSQPALDSRVDPAKSPADDAKDAPPASRFNAVIEKIERLYMGKNSSDEEDLNDVPDDDEYDTEDSFIDDAELDEYFQVDNSAIKHDGFFVNRGKLERINEPAISPHTQQQKKRKRKDLAKGPGGNDEGNAPNKNLAGKKAAGKSLTLPEKNSANQTLVMALPTVKCEDMITQNQSCSSGINVKKKSATVKSAQHHSSLRVSNGEAIAEDKGGKFKAGVLPVKNHGSKSKDGNAFSDMSQMLNGNISSGQGKPLSGISLGIGGGVGQSAQHGELNRIRERSDSIYSEGRNSMQATRKEGSSIKSKATMLEKAIRELEKMVAESRPPSTEASDADISQNIKRRMPPEIKPKLAKIARLAHSAHGKISKELLNRLMSIVGHLIQLRTLKRNLKVLGDMGLSAKEENNARFQQIKKEISEMVKVRIPLMKSKALELPGGTSDDFQENGAVDKEVHKRKFSMDDALEDKICDLYDFYIEGVEEDSGPQAHKLYAELADLWPKGFMDNSGIKRAICRAKDRKKARHSMNKNQDKMKRKSNSKTDEARQGEINSVLQSQYAQEKLVADSRGKSADKSVSGITIAVAAQVPNATVSQHVERPKQEKVKVNSNDIKKSDIVGKRKLKNKSEMELGEADSRSDKMITEPGEERNKSLKQTAASSPRTAL